MSLRGAQLILKILKLDPYKQSPSEIVIFSVTISALSALFRGFGFRGDVDAIFTNGSLRWLWFMDEKALIYEFRGFRLDVKHQRLTQEGKEIPLTPKGYQTLLLLVQSSGRVLEKEELIKALWPDSFVEEGNLSQNIFVLRKLLGDAGNGDRLIETIPRRGYKFVAPVTQVDADLSQNGDGRENGALSSLPADYWNHHSPFRGLQVFEPEDAWLFFGRDSDTQELVSRLARFPVLVVIGNSGSGKSSLIRAGLIPALGHGQFHWEGEPIQSWRIALVRPSSSPFDYLAETLPSALAPELNLKEQTEFIASCRQSLPSGADALRNAICALERNLTENSGRTGILLAVDQFEELFTLCASQDIRQRYISALLATNKFDGAVPVYLVLVLRADFYANCLEHPELSRCLESNVYNLQRMTEDQLREAIERRLALAGAQAEPGLISSLLVEVGTEPGNLALLEYALSQLWDKCRPANILTSQAYAEIGRLRGALSNHADEVYGNIHDEQKILAQRIFLTLVQFGEGGQDTRRRVKKSELISLGNPDELERMLDVLAASRLISITKENNQNLVEVSHEALIREWPTLREWISRNRDELRLERQLIQAAREWHAFGKDRGALLQGAKLSQAEVWFGGHQDAPALLQEFLHASAEFRSEETVRQFRAQQKELHQQRTAAVRLRWFSYTLAVMLLVAFGAAWFAHRQQKVAQALAMAAQSEEMLTRDQGRALDLAFRGWNTAKTEETYFALTKALPQTANILKHDAEVMKAVFSPDAKRILTSSWDHTAKIWDAADGHLLATLRAHTDGLVDAIFSPDGRRIVTSSLDHTARVWDATDGRLLATLQGHTDVLSVAFSSDSRHIVTAGWDHTARVWNTADGRLLNTLQGHTDKLWDATFSPDGQLIVTTSSDHTARIWNTADGRLLTILQGHSDTVYCAEFSPDGERIVTASWDHTARVWNTANGRLLNVLLGHTDQLLDARFSPDGQRIVTVSSDHTARIWNVIDGQLLATLRHEARVNSADFSPDGKRIATASWDHTARVWNTADGHLLATFQGHTGLVTTVAFSSDGERIVTASWDHTARVWIASSGRLLTTLQGHTDTVFPAKFSADGERIVTASSDHTARLWNTADGRLLATLQGHTDKLSYAAFSPDGSRIVTASWDHTARLWKSADGRVLAILQGHTDAVKSAEFSSDGQRIVTASLDHTARIWNTSDGHPLAILQGHTDAVQNAEFSSDGQRIVTASLDHTARIWNTADGHLLVTLQGHTDKLLYAVFSPDGSRIVTASSDHTARVWNTADGRLLAILEGHTDTIIRAKFSPGGERIATASKDHTVRLWNTADGRLLATLQGGTDPVWDAAFSPDGQRIVTASGAQTAGVWNTADGRLLATLQGHTAAAWDAMFSPDGQRIVTASPDHTARVWQVVTLDDIQRILTE